MRRSTRDRPDRLAEYRSKRDVERSGEPVGGSSQAGPPRFVVQRHDASSLHFDLRLEIDDVLVSWAVPKGPSTDPRDKRLATRTEDHPLDYVDFEGRIAEGEYGAGTVIVWDRGTYSTIDDEDASAALARGRLKVWLEGQKISGGYALTHTKMRGDERNWLLVKMTDEKADRRRRPTTAQPQSVVSGRVTEDL